MLGSSLGFLAGPPGGITKGAADLVEQRQDPADHRADGQSGITDAFLAAMVGMLGMVAALYVVSSVLRLHGEETSQRAEPVLANAVGRLRWAGGHLVVAFGGAALIMALGGLGLGIGYGHELGPVLGACLVQVAAVCTLGGLAVLLYGVSPRLAPALGAAGVASRPGWIGLALERPPGRPGPLPLRSPPQAAGRGRHGHRYRS